VKLRLVALPLLALLVVAGCSDDDTVSPRPDDVTDGDLAALEAADEAYWDEDVVPTDDDMFNGLARIARTDAMGVAPTVRTYEITIENLTPANGGGASQVFSPPVLATHNGSVRIYREGQFASDELAGVAEDAMNQPLVDLLEASNRTHEIVVGDGVIPPGASATYTIATSAGRRLLSSAWMLVNTNDAFSGIDGLPLPVRGEAELELYAYDAGSEVNDELLANIPGPCCGNPGSGEEERERIALHEGITGRGELDVATWDWGDEPVARVTIRRLNPAFEITVRNLTPDNGNGASQVFSPPVLTTHSPGVRMFRPGRFASAELAGLAEDALNQPMIDLLEGSRRALDVQVAGGPIPPGAEDTWTLEIDRGFRRLSMAFMLVNTNDAFSGVDALRLPRSGAVTYRVRAYDAGSEVNDELIASIPGPCCGNPGSGVDERERIRAHQGIRGVGDLAPETYDWDEPAAEIHVVRIR